jgi:pentatricopeptide repeat protein
MDYGSMVDLLCRSDMLDEAFEFVLAMTVKP